MKSKSLYGVRFAQDEILKSKILAHYKNWKERAMLADIEAGKISQRTIATLPYILRSPDGRLSMDFTLQNNLLSENACKHYLITGTVLVMCEKIRVKEPFELQWLDQVPNGKRQLNFGDTFIRYEKTERRINAFASKIANSSEGNDYTAYCFFHFDLAAGTVSRPQLSDDFDPLPPIPPLTFEDQVKKQLYQLIIFMELAPIEEIFVAPGQKHGEKKHDDKLVNEAKFPITVVNSSWNKIIRTDEFHVDGYFKKQHYGPSNRWRQLIWVNPYKKQGYNLGALRNNERARVMRPFNNVRKGRRR